MEFSRSILIASLVACPVLAASDASAVLLDDFESYLLGSVRDQAPANTVWDTNGSGLPQILTQSGNQYMGWDWSASGYRGAHRDLGGEVIGATDTSTVYFQFRQTNETGDDAIGVTDLNDPGTVSAGFPSFRAGINMVDDGNTSNNLYNLKAGATTITTGLSEGQWYNAWLVINNATDTMDVYITDGSTTPTVGDKVNGAPVPFINGTANPLDRFVVSGGLGTSQNAHIDNISIESGAINPALFFDDFESYTANANVPTSGQWGVSGGTGDAHKTRDEGTASPFGSPNQYGELIDDEPVPSTGEGIRLLSGDFSEPVGAVSTFSFDFYEPAGGGASPIRAGYSIDNDLNSSKTRNSITLDDGSLGGVIGGDDNSYALDTAYTLYMIFNDTGSDFDYAGGTIAAGEAHVWIEELDSGVFVFAGNSADVDANTDSTYSIGFRTFTSEAQSLFVDNVELSLGAVAVPEPTSLALLGLGGLLVSRRRR